MLPNVKFVDFAYFRNVFFVCLFHVVCFMLFKDNVQLRTTLEIMKSLIIISDFFTEPAQFTWLFDTCMMLHSKHPIEDDIMHQYIVLGICKSASVMIPSVSSRYK